MSKKFFAVLAAGVIGATVAQANSIESANIVGYQEISIPKGFSLYTVTFKNVAGGDYNVQDMIPMVNGAQLTGMNQVTFQKCSTDGSYGTTYGWLQARGGWCQGMVKVNDVTLLSGEAVCFNSKQENVMIRVSGAVELTPYSHALKTGFNLVGNMTPATINLQDIVPYVGETQLTGMNQVTLQKCNTDGSYATTYGWLPARGGWCQGMAKVENVTFEPGEAFCINVKVAGVVLKFKSPIVE